MIHPLRWLWDNVWWPRGVRIWDADLEKADELRKEGRYDESRVVLQRLLKLHRDDVTARERLRALETAPEVDRAMSLYNAGELSLAEAALREVANERRDYPEPYLHLAWVLDAQGREDEAAEQAARGVQLDPTGLHTLLIAAEVAYPASPEAAEGYLARIDELLARPGERERHSRVIASVTQLREHINASRDS